MLGFFGKYFAFVPAADAGLMPLVIIALVFSVVGAFYYLRVIKTMWFDEPKNEFVEAPASLRYIANPDYSGDFDFRSSHDYSCCRKPLLIALSAF